MVLLHLTCKLEKGHSSCLCWSSIQQNRALHRHSRCNPPSLAATGLGLLSRLSHLSQLPRLSESFGKTWLKLNSPQHRQPVVPWMLYCILLIVSGQCQCLHVLCHACQPCAHTYCNLGFLKWYHTFMLCKVSSPTPQMLSYILFCTDWDGSLEKQMRTSNHREIVLPRNRHPMPSERLWGIQGACVGQTNTTQNLWETHKLLKAKWKTPGHPQVHTVTCVQLYRPSSILAWMWSPPLQLSKMQMLSLYGQRRETFPEDESHHSSSPHWPYKQGQTQIKISNLERDKLGQVNPSVPSSNTYREDSLEWIDGKHPSSTSQLTVLNYSHTTNYIMYHI